MKTTFGSPPPRAARSRAAESEPPCFVGRGVDGALEVRRLIRFVRARRGERRALRLELRFRRIKRPSHRFQLLLRLSDCDGELLGIRGASLQSIARLREIGLGRGLLVHRALGRDGLRLRALLCADSFRSRISSIMLSAFAIGVLGDERSSAVQSRLLERVDVRGMIRSRCGA